MIEWEATHREAMPYLLELQRRGRRVTLLEERPRLPDHLLVVAQARQDIGGEVELGNVLAWFRAAGIDPEPDRFFWLLDRIRAVEALHRERDATNHRPRGAQPPDENASA